MPTVIALCGLPGSGKTTRSKQIESDRPALRFSEDDWVLRLYGAEAVHDDRIRELIKEVQWDLAAQALRLGVDVVLDWGFWGRSERDDFRARTAALGATFELEYLDVPRDEMWHRVQARNAIIGPDAPLYVDKALFDVCWGMFQPPTLDEIPSDGC